MGSCTDSIGKTLVWHLRDDAYELPSLGPWIERDGSSLPSNSCSQAADEIERLCADADRAKVLIQRLAAEVRKCGDLVRDPEALALAATYYGA